MADAMRYFVLLLLLVRSLLAQEVKHAPTVEQCQADQRLWLAKLEGSAGASPDFVTLEHRSQEMDDCISVDPANHAKYYNVESEILAAQAQRLLSFISRHELYDKFIEEDKAGKR
jgi:hypothetical protein